MNCILIENDPSLIYLFQRYVTTAGFRLLVVSSGDGALQAARQASPAAILLDAAFLEVESQVLQKLEADAATRDVPVIMWSDQERRRDLQVDCYLPTPVGYWDFVAALEKLCPTPTTHSGGNPMRKCSKYQPLFERLRGEKETCITFSFAEIEMLLGMVLPSSARSRRNWWSNRTSSPRSAAWIKAGYRLEALDLERETVTFFKPDLQTLLSGGAIPWNGELVRALRRHMRLNQTELARRLGVRQQTVSEWETGVYAPGRKMRRELGEIASRSGFLAAANGR